MEVNKQDFYVLVSNDWYKNRSNFNKLECSLKFPSLPKTYYNEKEAKLFYKQHLYKQR